MPSVPNKIICYSREMHAKHPRCVAFADGLKRHGHTVQFRDPRHYEPSDLCFFWSARKRTIINQQRENRADYLVLENGYIGDRLNTWMSAGFNGLNGEADFHARGCDDKRRLKYGFKFEPWHYGGRYILICGQVSGDASLRGIQDMRAFYETLAAQLKDLHRDYPVYYRPHPLEREVRQLKHADTPPEVLGDIEEAIRGAYLVVAYNSNSAVDAIMLGKPAVTLHRGSMAWPVTTHYAGYVARPDRTAWLNNLAYCQWKEKEFTNGTAWDHLKGRYD